MPILLRVLLPSLMFCGGGCLHTEHSLDLHPDGSGTLAVTYAVPQRTLELVGEEQENRFEEEAIRSDFADRAIPGVDLLDVDVKASDAGRAVGLRLAFDALENIARTEFYQESSLALQRTPAGTYQFTQMPNAPRREPRSQEERDLMKGFRFTMNVTVPGRIVTTNADRTKGGTATWRFDLDENPGSLERMDAMVYEIEFAPAQPGLPEYARPRVRLHPPPARPDPIAETAP